ncbi:MAG: hypothetical protein AAFQ41_03135 [Cyanobacteria bacterium J06623_7]
MTWTKKYDLYSAACRLRQSDERLLRYILRRSKQNTVCEIEIDLRTFNQSIAKHRGNPYDRKTIKSALWRLDELTNGLVLVTKSYTWAIHKIIVRPLFMVLEQKSQAGDNSPKPNRCNPMFSDAQKRAAVEQQQQNISKLDSLFTKIGIKFDYAALKRVWKLSGKSMVDITSAVELLLHRHSTQTQAIKNPQGFIIECLKQSWQKGFNLFYQPELPQFESAQAIANYVATVIDYDSNPKMQT